MQRIPRATFLTALGSTLAACSHGGTIPADALARSAQGRNANAIAQATVAPSGVVAAVQDRIDRYIRTNHDHGRRHVACVVGIVTPEAPSAKLLFGGSVVAANNHQRSIPLNGDTPFEIGSITKTFASTIFLRRHRSYDGVLGDFVKNILPVRVANIPIRNLANYSPGMPPDNHGPIWWNGVINANSVEDLASTLAGKTYIPHCQPGLHFSYSNFGWGLIGMAGVGVENMHDRPLQKWKHEITELGHDLGFSNVTQPALPTANTILPAGYSESGLLPESTTYDRASWNTLFGGGDLISNGDDMYRWLLFNMGRLNPDVAFLHKQQDPTFTWTTKQPQVRPDVHSCVTEATPHNVVTSMAWFHHTLQTPAVTYLWKDGGVAGFTSWMGFKQWIDSGTPSDVGMFVLTNQAGAADILGPQILAILLHANEASPPAEQLGDEFPGLG